MSALSKLFSRMIRRFSRREPQNTLLHKANPSSAHTIPENRPLSPDERALIEWLIANGVPEAKGFAHQLEGLHVVGRCGCGCPTVDLATADDDASTTGPSHILAEFLGLTPQGSEVGVILHTREGKLSELEIYELEEPARSLPTIGSLEPLEW